MISYLIYITAGLLLATGIYLVIASDSYFYKMIALNIMQGGVLVFYISLGKIMNAAIPIDICPYVKDCQHTYSSPLPSVLMLTAIVVGFATLSVGLALIIKIKHNFGTINESELDVS